eukprot:4510653-Amphidinium_carterae.1
MQSFGKLILEQQLAASQNYEHKPFTNENNIKTLLVSKDTSLHGNILNKTTCTDDEKDIYDCLQTQRPQPQPGQLTKQQQQRPQPQQAAMTTSYSTLPNYRAPPANLGQPPLLRTSTTSAQGPSTTATTQPAAGPPSVPPHNVFPRH